MGSGRSFTNVGSGILTCNHRSAECTCPFAFTEESERVQNYGCLPTPYEIVVMRVEYGKTWACHDQPTRPCIGALRHLRSIGQPYKVIDLELVTEASDWAQYATSAIDLNPGAAR